MEVVFVGQIWNISSRGRLVRMRVASIDPSGQIILVEDAPEDKSVAVAATEVDERPWLRALVTSAPSLAQAGSPAYPEPTTLVDEPLDFDDIDPTTVVNRPAPSGEEG